MDDNDEYHKTRWPILAYIKNTLLAPIRIATSPTLLRTYLRTLLVLATSGILFAIAVLAYTTFYFSYIPVRGISVPVYLQFDHRQPPSIPTILTDAASGATSPPPAQLTHPSPKFPHGIANIAGLVSRQKYDVVVDMVLPRSDKNLGAGNFMVGLDMRGPRTAGGGVKQMLGYGEEWDVDDYSQSGGVPGKEKDGVSGVPGAAAHEKPVVLARSRRPAILTYRSWMTEMAYRSLRLPLYVVGLGEESERIVVRMMEMVEFEKGWRSVPTSLRLEVRSKTPLEVYKVSVRFVARLEGLRWVMYHYRLSSFAVFTALFWAVEMALVLVTWALFSVLFGAPTDSSPRIKKETKEPATPKTEPTSAPTTPLSDTSRTFPTLPSQHPLHYTSPPDSSRSSTMVKDERGAEDIPARGEADADDEEDEDEYADFLLREPVPVGAAAGMTDSGLGTSLESTMERDRERDRDRDRDNGLVRRRSGRR